MLKNTSSCRFSRIALAVLVLTCCRSGRAQEKSASAAKPDLQVLYTGRLLGYFRVPSHQPGDGSSTCQSPENTDPAQWSNEAQEFHDIREQVSDAILLGTGDNFAPEFGSRVLNPPPLSKGAHYANKDQYLWYPAGLPPDGSNPTPRWIDLHAAESMKHFQTALRNGQGKIEMDNVGCFLLNEQYSAVVPGRHDFYYGAERLRELARYLEDPDINHTQSSVHMLGANLVIETTWKDDHKPLPDTEREWKYAPKWPSHFQREDHLAVPGVSIPGDENKVYPWSPGAVVKLATPESELYRELLQWSRTGRKTEKDLQAYLSSSNTDRAAHPNDAYQREFHDLSETVNAFTHDHVYLCESSQIGYPDDIKPPSLCGNVLEKYVLFEDGGLEYLLQFEDRLKLGQNYGLCVKGDNLPQISKIEFFCQRFSVYRPLFSYSVKTPLDTAASSYALIPRSQAQPVDAVVFGAVDPTLVEYVGALNLQWENKDSNDRRTRYKTTVAAQDPSEALREAMLAFDWEHPGFGGIRILLAQMSPQKAQILAQRIKRIDLVVSAADYVQAGTGASDVAWIPDQSSPQHPAFLAVPAPYYEGARSPKRIVQINSASIDVPKSSKPNWEVRTYAIDPRTITPTEPQVPLFWDAVSNTIDAECLPSGSSWSAASTKQQDRIQAVTLCSLQKEVGADVVLLQERDFFVPLPPDIADLNARPTQLREILDRIVWKGDFLATVHVPGSTLVQVMQQSKKYKADDASALSLSDERGRALVALGMTYDSDRAEYLIDGTPLDPKRLYAVATSDYIAAADTGYPDLATAAVGLPKVPGDFPDELYMISALVCRAIAPHARNVSCQDDAIKSEEYFDALEVEPADTRHGQTPGRQLYSWTPFDVSHKVPGETPQQTALRETDKEVQRRGLGSLRINQSSPSLLALDNNSVSFTSVNHKFTDTEMKQLFPGSPVTQLTTTRSHTVQFDLKPKYTYSWNHMELFQGQELRYNVQYTGQVPPPRVENQKENLWSTDTGILFHVPNRHLPHVEPVFTFHTETQVLNPLPNFLQSLATSGKSTPITPFDQSRTYLLLPRLGLRYAERESWIEVGAESGGELNVVRLLSTPAGTLVNRPDIRENGLYWNWHTVVPFHPIVSLQFDEDGDYFFNNHDDNPIDTRFRSDSETALNFKVWPSLSFSPTYEFFLYSNKVQGVWFWQGQASVKLKFRLDFWNHRGWTKQIQYAPSK